MHTKTAFVVLAALASAASVGCGSSGSDSTQPTGTTRASLHRAKNCGDLLTDLRADAIFKMDRAISRQILGVQACMQRYPDAQCANVYGGIAFGNERGVAVDNATGAPPPQAPGSGAETAGGDSAKTYSETNTQVKGVDEADIVKNDGKNLYVLHGRSFKILNAWPATELKEVSSIDVEGTPTEMFVADGKVVVYSQVNGDSVFRAAGVTPKQQYSGYGYPGAPMVDRAEPAMPGKYPGTPGVYIPLTKVTVMALNGTTPSVTREVYFEGSYLDARRVGPHVRTVLQGYQYGPRLKQGIYELYAQPEPNTPPDQLPYPKTGSETIAALEQLRSANTAIINASQLSDWLPYTFVKDAGSVSAHTVKCEDFYVPTAGSTESGLTEVASLDLSDPVAVPKETAILGRADTVYGSADTLYLAARAWVEPPFVWSDPGDVAVGTGGSPGRTEVAPARPPVPDDAPAPSPTPEGKQAFKMNVGIRNEPVVGTPPVQHYATNQTHIHKFEFKSQPTFPNYVASGTVEGNVKNQFSLDEKDGLLRIATTENRMYVTTDNKPVQPDFAPPGSGAPPPARPSSVNHLFVLGENAGWLDVKGSVGDLAPNEQIYSVRFVEHRGYVVTFRQVDPLFVVDLANPTSPTLLAALKIPGFSEYMHPLDANHLLTIGRDATTEGRVRGLQLQIFDVTNGANPILQHKFTYSGDEYGSSEAQYDHKAFTFFAEKNMLAFPYLAHGTSTGMRSSLELFRVDLGVGFTKLGSIDHTPLLKDSPNGYCGGYYNPSVRRGVFLENFVYSVSYGGVVVKNANDLVVPAAQVALPAPQINEGYGPVCGR